MITENVEVSTAPPSTEATRPAGPGSRLRKLRESKKLSVDEIAKRLRFTSERILQIEKDDYHLMGASAFAKGYIRAYANQLGASKEEILTILQAFDTLGLGSDIHANPPQLIHEKIAEVSPNTSRRITSIIAIVMIAAVAYWWYSHSKANSAAATASNAAASTAAPAQLEILPDAANSDVSSTAPISAPMPAAPNVMDNTSKTNSSSDNANAKTTNTDTSTTTDSKPISKLDLKPPRQTMDE